MRLTKIKFLWNYTMLKNFVYVKLILCNVMKKATMEDVDTTSISSSNGWRSNRNYFQLHQGTAWYKEIWNSSIQYELNCQWNRANIDNRHSVCITVEYFPKNKAKDDHRFSNCANFHFSIDILALATIEHSMCSSY